MEETRKKLAELGALDAIIYAQASPVNDAAGSPTGITLRLPLLIGGSAKPLQAGQPDAQPPFVELPGFAYGYEVQVGGQPAYAYFASVASGEKTADQLQQEIVAAMGRAFSSAVWADVALKTPEGGTLPVKRLSVMGPQKFGAEVQDGRFDLYLISSSTHHVLLGWRAPVVAANSESLFENVAISVGTAEGSG